MFKKFKDKLAEEMKQSPARFQASMQQLAQAVVSPAQSNNSIQELSMSNDSFNIMKEIDETPRNSPVKHTFQNVDLISPLSNSMDISRRSSTSSITSDITSLFPVYESSKNVYHIQSDMEQSATEIDDNINPQLDRITKDQLYLAYRKVQTKYQKYRERYTDLATHYRDLEKVKNKLESLLVETQDNVLRRIGDLKEQCHLEQQAKAHLEEVLRNDIEEKNHIIDTLNTKIKLLQNNTSNVDNASIPDSNILQNNETDIAKSKEDSSINENSTLLIENAQLKNKLEKLETIFLKYKESLKRNKEKIDDVIAEKDTIKRDYETLQILNIEKCKELEKELNEKEEEIINLKEQVGTLKKREEESVISLAENKLSIHRELEGKEEQIKQLQFNLMQVTESKENLTDAVEKYKAELKKFKLQYNIQLDKNDNQDMLKGHTEHVENDEVIKTSMNVNTDETLEQLKLELQEKDSDLQKMKVNFEEAHSLAKEYHDNAGKLEQELITLKTQYTELKNEYDAQVIIADERRKETETIIGNYQSTVHNLDEELENIRSALVDRDQVCETFNIKIQEYTAKLDDANQKILTQDVEINKLKINSDNEISQLQDQLENKNTELLGFYNKLKSCKMIISNLKLKIQTENSKIEVLNKEKISLVNNILYYKNSTEKLKQDCRDLKNSINEAFLYQKKGTSLLNATITDWLKNVEQDKEYLKSEIKNLNIKLNVFQQNENNHTKLQIELAETKDLKSNLEQELEKYKKLLEQSIIKTNHYDKLCIKNKKFIAEIDNLNFKVHDLEQMQNVVKKIREITEFTEKIDILKNMKVTVNEFYREPITAKVNASNIKNVINELDLLKNKFENIITIITSLQSKDTEHDLLQQELEALKSKVNSLQDNKIGKDNEIKEVNEKLISKEEEIANIKMECEDYMRLMQENMVKIAELKKIHKKSNKSHEEEIMEFTQSINEMQEIIDVRTNKLRKLKIIKNQQTKDIQEMTEELQKYKTENIDISTMLETLKAQIEMLENENQQLSTLKDEKALISLELEQMKLTKDQINLENKNLNVKQHELVESNKKLHKDIEALKSKILEYKNNKQEFLNNAKLTENEVESYKHELIIQNEDLQKLKSQLEKVSVDLQSKNEKLEIQNEKMKQWEQELQNMKEALDMQSNELHNKNTELNLALKNCQLIQEEKNDLLTNMQILKEQNKYLKSMENENLKFKKEIYDLNQKISELQETLKSTDCMAQKHQFDEFNVELKPTLQSVQTENNTEINANNIEENKHCLNTTTTSNIINLDTEEKCVTEELKELNNIIERKSSELKLLNTINADLLQENEKLRISYLKAIAEKVTEVDMSSNSKNDFKQKMTELKSQVESLNKLNCKLNSTLKIAYDYKNIDETLIEQSNKLQEENKKLEAQLDEALLTFQAKESQIEMINSELRDETYQLKKEIKMNEEEQNVRIKQLVKEFQAQLQEKEDELLSALDKRFDYQQNYESNLIQQYKEQLKDLHIELTTKSEQLENFILESKDINTEKEKEISSLIETIAQIKKEHVNELKELEQRWKIILQQRSEKLEAKHEEEVKDLTKEWQNERKELESTSCIAMAAVQSNTGSFHTFQKTLASQSRELVELRKLVKLKHDTLEDSTEIEYLRNILFEYMMGKETMVLAKVIAAVVKFDQEQTAKILKKEEDKLTLLGSLGLT